jgi:hypothetical protein
MNLLHIFKKYTYIEKTCVDIENCIKEHVQNNKLKVHTFNYKYILLCDEQIQDTIDDIKITDKYDKIFRNCDFFAGVLWTKVLSKRLGCPCRDVSVFDNKLNAHHRTVMIINSDMQIRYLDCMFTRDYVSSIKYHKGDEYSIDVDREICI